MAENNFCSDDDIIQSCINIMCEGDYSRVAKFTVLGQTDCIVYKDKQLRFKITKIGNIYRPIYFLEKGGRTVQCFGCDSLNIEFLFDICNGARSVQILQNVERVEQEPNFKFVENRDVVKWKERLALLGRTKRALLGIRVFNRIRGH